VFKTFFFFCFSLFTLSGSPKLQQIGKNGWKSVKNRSKNVQKRRKCQERIIGVQKAPKKISVIFENCQKKSQRFSGDFLEPRHFQNCQVGVKSPCLATLVLATFVHQPHKTPWIHQHISIITTALLIAEWVLRKYFCLKFWCYSQSQLFGYEIWKSVVRISTGEKIFSSLPQVRFFPLRLKKIRKITFGLFEQGWNDYVPPSE